MMEKTPVCPKRVRKITGSFGFIEHRFLRDGFWQSLSLHELLLYVFLVLVADRAGLSYYSFDRICTLLGMSTEQYLLARNGLIQKDLIAFDGHLFQVLSLPERPVAQRAKPLKTKKREAFIRFESAPGEQCQVDWGHFRSLSYGNTKRKLYCLAVIESHSRMLYLQFTHSQKQETLHRCLTGAFRFFQGTPKELLHDNMMSAVIERDGPLVRFNEAFLEFLRPFKIVPRACTVARPQEKDQASYCTSFCILEADRGRHCG